MKQKKENWIQSDIRMEEIRVGGYFINHSTGQLSTVTDLTSNSIEMFNTANKKSFYKTGQTDADGEAQSSGRLKGFDSKNWYTLENFNREYKRFEGDVIEYKFEVLKKWLNDCITKQKWTGMNRLIY